MKILVVGLGLIGGSLALDLKHAGFAKRVVGWDALPEHGKKALELGLVDELGSVSEDVELIVLAVPVDAILSLLPDLLSQTGPGTTIMDLGSTKGEICHLVAQHPERARFVASHPMAGTEFSGPTAAQRGLFAGKAAVICEAARSAPAHLKKVEALYQCLGMRRVEMEPDEHDLHAAYVSHLSHISSFTLANTVLAKEKDVNAIFDLASGGFESTVRLAKSSPEMWAPIFAQNRARVIDALDAYIESLREFRQTLADADFEKTRALMRSANRIRPVLSRITAKKAP